MLSDPQKLYEYLQTNAVKPFKRSLGVKDDQTLHQAFTERGIPALRKVLAKGSAKAGRSWQTMKRDVGTGYKVLKADAGRAKEYAEEKVEKGNDQFKKYLLGLQEELNNTAQRKAPYQYPAQYDYPQ